MRNVCLMGLLSLLLTALTACGQGRVPAQVHSAPPPETASPWQVPETAGLRDTGGEKAGDGPAPEETAGTVPSRESTPAEPGTLSPQEEAARAAYQGLLSGDLSLVAYDPARPDRVGFTFSVSGRDQFEYTLLDLDGDGVSELLVQYIDLPSLYNGVFHYDGASLLCWNDDDMETSCRDYPLRDGTMVRQYDVGTGRNRYSHLYTLFRYQSDGEMEKVADMHIHAYFYGDGTPGAGAPGDGDCPSTVYGIGAEVVDEAAFQARFEELIGGQLLDRPAWTPLEPF